MYLPETGLECYKYTSLVQRVHTPYWLRAWPVVGITGLNFG
jgi:hypothetical protein